MTQQRFQIDGVPVVGCEGVFARAFDMDQADTDEVVYDQTYVMVVVCTTLPPGFRTDKNGELIRRNRFKVDAAKVARGALADELIEKLDLDVQFRLPFEPPPGMTAFTRSPPEPAERPVSVPVPVPVSVGAPVAAAVPVGVTVGQIRATEDDELRRFLDGGR